MNMKSIVRIRFGLILFMVCGLFSCGHGDFKNGSMLSVLDSDSFEKINDALPLPEEFAFDGIQAVEESDFVPLKGFWGKGFLIHPFSPQAYPRIDNGALEINMNYIPPQRFKLSFSFRSNGLSSFYTEVFSNRIDIYHKLNGKSTKIVEQPIKFLPERNMLRVYFCGDSLSGSFNAREIFRLRDPELAGKGFVKGISMNSANNLGSRTPIRYFSLESKTILAKYEKVYNKFFTSGVDSSVEKYIRSARIGDTTMSAIFAPSPCRFIVPVSIPKFADLRFSVSTLPVVDSKGAVVHYKVDFLEKGEDKAHTIFDTREEPSVIFDQKWTSCRVDLTDYYGKDGSFIFSAELEGKGKIADKGIVTLWGAPRILITPKRAETRNVILITVENFGSESLKLKANLRPLTPSILNWAEDSVVFRRAYPVSKWAAMSLFSILRGNARQSEEYLSWLGELCPSDDRFAQSLPSVFSQNGYDTAAFIQGVNGQPFLGFSDGFNEFFNDNKFPDSEWDIANSEKLAERAALWIQQRINKNCFVHIHLSQLSRINMEYLYQNVKDERNLLWEFWKMYGEALSREDGYTGKVLRSLWKVGALKNALIVVAGTDGIDVPSLDDNAKETVLGNDQYIRVPVVFSIQSKFPPTGERLKTILLSDIYSTILDYMNFTDSNNEESISFLKNVENEEEAEPENRLAITSLSNPLEPNLGYAITEGKIKGLFINQETKKEYSVFFFDIEADSNERSPLSKDKINKASVSAEFNDNAKRLLDIRLPYQKNDAIKHYIRLAKEINSQQPSR